MKKLSIFICALLLCMTACAHPYYGFSHGEDIQEGIKNVYINLSSEELEIIETSNDEMSVNVKCSDRRFVPEITWDDTTLRIRSNRPFISVGSHYCKVQLYVPSDYEFEAVKISMSSGTSEIDYLKSEDLKITSTSGSINAKQLCANSRTLIESTSGSIRIHEIESNSLIVASTSGSIKLNDVECEFLEVSSTSGSQSINGITCDYFMIDASSGTIRLELDSAPTEDSKISTSSGSVKLTLPRHDGLDIYFTTSSGSLRDSVEHGRLSRDDSYYGSYNGGGPEIRIRTSSGSLEIND